MNCTSHLDALAAGCRASETVHAYLKKELSGFAIKIEYVAYDRILCNFHVGFSFLNIKSIDTIIYYTKSVVNTFLLLKFGGSDSHMLFKYAVEVVGVLEARNLGDLIDLEI